MPEKTSLAGRFRREVLCAPVDNEETRHILDVRAMESLKAKKLTTVLGAKKGLEGKGIIHAGTTAANFSSFIVRYFCVIAPWRTRILIVHYAENVGQAKTNEEARAQGSSHFSGRASGPNLCLLPSLYVLVHEGPPRGDSTAGGLVATEPGGSCYVAQERPLREPVVLET